MSIKEENVYKYEKKTQKTDSFDDCRLCYRFAFT